MNKHEIRLQRLMASARTAPAAEAGTMPAHLRARVLAHWRSDAASKDLWRGLVLVFRGALACAAAVMLASIAWSLDTHEPVNDVAIANYELRADAMP